MGTNGKDKIIKILMYTNVYYQIFQLYIFVYLIYMEYINLYT